MNRKAHRVVFNQKRGQLMVVAESAQSQSTSGASGDRTGRAQAAAISPMAKHPTVTLEDSPVLRAIQWLCQTTLVWLGSASLVMNTAQAQAMATRITADNQALSTQQATILKTANGIVQVNIQTPSSAGVSRNIFSQFDVGSSGLVINNSRSASTSQLAGGVQANPWLARGAAKVILNEVNAKDSSQIQGTVEVAGQRAEMVIANPSGIVVNGGKFINASQVTLSTGRVALGADGLPSHNINQGLISIEGKGLDTLDADYTRILSQAAQINAKLWAQDLQVVTGNNQIQVNNAEIVITARKDRPADAAKPMFALDVKQLGGMYAGKIHLIGTENGLGVNNAGVMQASAGPLTLQSNGWLSNSGVMHAQGPLSIQTQGPIEHSGSITAQGSMDVAALGAQATVSAQVGSLLAAGMDMQGQPMPKGDMTVQAQGGAALHGQMRSAGDMRITAAQLQLSQSTLTGQRIELNATPTQPQTVSPAVGIDLQQAQVRAQGPLHITTNHALQTDSADIAGQSLHIQVQSLSNRDGKMVQTGSADQQLHLGGALDNTGGTLKTNAQNLTLSAAALHNAGGQILHAGSGPLTLSTGQLDNTQGSISSAGNIQLSAASLNNAQGKIYAQGQQSIQVQGVLSHQGEGALIAAQGQQTLAAQQLQAGAGSLIASGLRPDGTLADRSAVPSASLDFQVREGLQLQGDVLSAGALNMQAASLIQGGRTVAQGGIQAKADVVQIDGQLQSGARLQLDSASELQLNGDVQSLGDMQLSAATETHLRGNLVSRAALRIDTDRYTSHSQSQQTSIGATTVNSPSGIDLQGQTTAASALNLVSQNTQIKGPLKAAQTAVVGKDITLGVTGQPIDVVGALNLNMQGQVQIQSDLSTGSHLHITSAGATRVSGSVQSAGVARLQSAGSLTIEGGVQAAQALSMISNDSVQVGQGVQGAMVEISGQMVQVANGVTSTSGNLDIRSAQQISIGQELSSAQDLSLQALGSIVVQGTSSSLGHTRMTSNANIALQKQATATGAMQLIAAGQLNAEQSLVAGAIGIQAQDVRISKNLQSGGVIDVNAKTLQVGQDIESGQTTRIVATGGAVTAKNMRSQSDIQVQATAAVRAESFSALHNLSLTSQTADIKTGQVLAGGALQMQAKQDITGAAFYAQGNVHLQSDLGILRMDTVQSGSAIRMQAGQSIHIDDKVASAQALSMQAAGRLVVQGEVQSGSGMTLNGQSLDIGGSVYSGADLQMQAALGDITLYDSMQARGNASLMGQNIQLQGAQVLGDLDMQTQGVLQPVTRSFRMVRSQVSNPITGGNIVSSQSVVAGGVLNVKAPGAIQVTGHMGSGKNMAITAQGAVQATGMIVSGLSQTNNAQAHMRIDTAKGLVAQSIRSQGNMNLTVGADLQTGAMLAMGELSAQTQSNMVATGGIQGSQVTVQSDKGNIQTAQVVSHGNLTLQAAQNISSADLYAGTQSTHTTVLTAGQNIRTGNVQNQGRYTASAKDQVQVKGDLISAGATQITAGTSIDNQGHVWSGGDLTETAGTHIVHEGDTAANGNVALSSAASLTLGTSSNKPGGAGGVRAAGTIHLKAAQALDVAGSVLANGHVDIGSQNRNVHIGADLNTMGALTLQSQGQVLVDGSVNVREGTLTSQRSGITVGKDLRAQTHLNVSAAQDLNVSGKTAVGGNLALQSTQGSVSVGALQVSGSASLVARQDLTLRGPSLLLGQTQLSAQQGSLNIYGNMQLAGDFYIRQSGNFNQQGLITSRGNIDIEAGNITSNTVHEGGLQAGGQLNLKAANNLTLGVNGQYVGIAGVNTAAQYTSQAGLLQTNGVYNSANWLINTGTINAQRIEQVGTLVNTGRISASNLRAGTLSNSGQVVGQTMNFGDVDNLGIVQGQNITMGSVFNRNRLSATDSIVINGSTYNTGTLGAVNNLQVLAHTQSITNKGHLLSDTLDLQGQKLINFGNIQAGSQLNVVADQVTNGLEESPYCIAGYYICRQEIDIWPYPRLLTETDFLWSQQRGIMTSGKDLKIKAGQMVNAGVIQAVGKIELDTAQTLINIRSENDLQSSNNQPPPKKTNNSTSTTAEESTEPEFKPTTQTGLITAGGDVLIQAQTFENVRGQVLGKKKITITTKDDLNNVRDNPEAHADLVKDAFIQHIEYGNYHLIPKKPASTGTGTGTGTGSVVPVPDPTTEPTTAKPEKDEFAPVIQGADITLKAAAILNEGLVHATKENIQATATKGDILNKFLQKDALSPDPVVQNPPAQNPPVQDPPVHIAQWVAQKKLLLTADKGDIVNGKTANLLANDEITLKAKDFTNDGTLFGLQSAVKKIDITTSGNVYNNNKDAIIIADQELNLNITSGHNKGTIGSFGDLTLNAPTVNIGIVDNPLLAKKKLTLNVDRVTVGLGQSWVSDAEQVSWTGKLYNNGSVILAGTAQGDVDNLADSFVTRTEAPNQGQLAGSYKLNPPVYNLGKDTVVVEEKLINYSDVVNRAFFQSAGLTGHLRNFASDVVGGVSTYEPISQTQWALWRVSFKRTAPAPGQDPATFDPEQVETIDISGTSESLARLYLPKPASITLVGPKPGTIVGQDVSVSGGDLVLDNSSQPGTNTAGSAAVQPGQLEPMGPPAPTTVQVTAQSTDMQGVQGMEPLVNTPSPADLVAPDKFAGPPAATLGDMPNGKAPSVQPILVANSPASTAAAAAAAAAPDGRPAPLNLNLGAAQTAAQALGTMNAGNASVNWAALAPVAGSIKADTLTLELTGSFKNMGPLLVSNALTINAAKGIDNSGATIDAGIVNINSHDGWLNNNGGTINAKTLTTDIAGQLNNTDGKISVVGDARLKTGDVVATNGVFASANGSFSLDSTGNIALKASTLSAQQGLLQLGALGNIDLGYTQGPKSHSAQTDRQEQAAVIIPGSCSEQGGEASYTVCTSDLVINPGSWQEKSTETTRDTFTGTQLNARQIDIRAGKDLNITASDLQSTGNIGLSAVGQVNVGAAIGTSQSKETQTDASTKMVGRWEGGENGSYYTEKQTNISQQTQNMSEEFAKGSQVKAGGVLLIQSGTDMHIDASQLQGDQGVALLSAGKVDITGQKLDGSSQSQETVRVNFFKREQISTTQETQTFAGSTITSGAGNVSAVALGDMNVTGSTLTAQKNLNLIADSVNVSAQVNTTKTQEVQGNPNGGRHWQTTDSQTQNLTGGELSAGQNLNMVAGMSPQLATQVGLMSPVNSAAPEIAKTPNSGNLNLAGAQLSAGTPGAADPGQINVITQGDLNIGTVELLSTSDTFRFDKVSKFGGNKTTTQRTITETHTQVGTSVSADQINVAAGGNLNMTGSAVSAAGDVNLAATGNVTIQAATNTETKYTENGNRSSGITSSGGLSLHVGTSSQKSQAWLDATSQSQGMSLVGSEFGSVNVTAGKDNKISGTILGTTSAGEIAAAKVANGTANAQETQEAKDWLERLNDANAKDPLLAIHPHNIPPRDINLSGQSVSVTSGLDTLDQRTKFEAQQSGVTVALSNAMVSTVQGAVSTGNTLSNAASNTSSSRMQGLAGAAGALAAYNTYNQAKDILKDPGKANDISVNVSLGSSKSSASSQDKSTTAVGSQVVSAGSVNVTARNPKPNPDGTTAPATANAGNILIEGSQVMATEDIHLNADRDITLLAAGNTSEHSSQNKSSSGSVGASFSGAGVSATASASRAKGQADGEIQSSTNTRVQAGGTLTFNSGGDTTLQGATASATQVTGTVGGNLNLSSLQDTSQYKENSQSSGFSVSVPITGGAASASVSHSKTKIDSTYQSVGEQTAIRAGDGGFDIDVKGKTTLTGAQITSTDQAVQGGKNSFKSAGGIDMQDLQNSAQFDADSFSVSATVRGDSRNEDGTPKLDTAGKPIQGKPEGSFGFGSDSGQGSSTSTSGISGIAGDTKARTGDKETGLKPLFDAAKTKAEVQSQVAITAEFGKNASRSWGDFATNKENELRNQGKHEEADKWREGGTYRAAGHFAIGGLGGGGAGALASGGISLAADKLNSLQDELKDKLIELGMSPDTAQMFSQGAGMATAGTLGTAAGGTVGGGSAFNTDTNNRQLHPEEKRLLKAKASDFADKLRQAGYGAMTEERALAILTEQAENRVDETQAKRPDTETMDDNLKAEASKYINQISSPAGTYDDGRGNQIKYFTNTTASGERRVEDYKNPNINAVPHVPAVDYVTVQGGGLGLGGAATVNLHNGEVFLGPSKSNISSGAGGSVTVGRMLDTTPEKISRGDAVSNMLGGASAQSSVCVGGVCVGLNQSIGEKGKSPTAIEIGLGTPGVSTGVGVSLPVPGTKK